MSEANKEWAKKNPHLFRKGQSGNPKGRPKKGKTFPDILEAELKKQKKILTDPKTGEERQIDGKTALCLAYISLAFNAEAENVKANCMEKIMKFIDGDFVQNVNMNANVKTDVMQDVKDCLDKLSPEDRDSYLELCDKMNEESETD